MINYSIQKTKEIAHFYALIRLFEDVFEMKDFVMPPADHLEKLLARDDFFVFVALLDDEVIGGLTSYTLRQYYSTSPLVYVFDLAVATAYQRKGIGKMLMTAIQKYCKDIDVEEVFVQADVADDYALDFYRSTGATGEDVVHFYYPLK